jgi:CelD/BcsL family acetyltransferase involved in cellulose biosynthesis
VASASLQRRAPAVLEITDHAWRQFTAAHPAALPYHDPEWARLIADCYGFTSFLVALRDDAGTILGGVPVIEVRRPLGRRRCVSLPFSDYCPPLTSSTDDVDDLVRAVEDSARARGVLCSEIRAELPGAQTSTEAVRHTLELEPDAEQLFRRFHRSQVQRNIRRAEREGVDVRQASREEDITGVFYRLHVATRRRLGLPVQPRRFFPLLWQRMLSTGRGYCLIASKDERPIAAAVFLTFSRNVTYKYGASDARFWGLRPNHAVFWSAIQSACRDGFASFDFGRSDLADQGLRQFKSGWGATEHPLAYSAVGQTPRRRPRPGGAAETLLKVTIRHSPEAVCRRLGELLYRYAA